QQMEKDQSETTDQKTMTEAESDDKKTMTEETEEEEQAGYMDISPKEAKKMIDEKEELVVVDVSPNYAKGHLPGAVNYYVGDGSLDKAIPTLDKTKEYLVYCHVESASRLGAQKMTDAGFEKVYRLEGDYPAWVKAGYPVEK
ncbi:MAG: hypothetical protein GF347_02020, partial [Candidatus Moranbacteria bacterium]|nr:hypothetical protein [Candidatus Moranbacteria bacterium]